MISSMTAVILARSSVCALVSQAVQSKEAVIAWWCADRDLNSLMKQLYVFPVLPLT